MSFVLENLWIAGTVIVVAVTAEGLWIAVDFFRCSAHEREQRRREAALLEERLKLAERLRVSEEDKGRQHAWSGWRKFEVTKKAHEDPGGQICSFYLAPHDGKPIPCFEPGQFLTFQLNVPGRPKPVRRCYSLSDYAANPQHYRISIKRIQHPNPGLVSNFFHEHVNEGDIVDVVAPNGDFVVDPGRDTPVVLLACGIGITPVLSMLNAITSSGSKRETWFFYGVRNRDEHIMHEHLQALERDHDHVNLRVCYSDPRSGVDAEGRDYHHAEWVSVDLLQRVLPSNNYDFYICGPTPMMGALIEGLGAWGVPEHRIHFEEFGPTPTAAKPAKPDAKGPPITFHKSDRTVPWDESFENLWEFALANGIELPSGCRQGNCGECMVAILDGKVKYKKKPSFQCEANSCLTCCSVPNGALGIDG